MTAPLTAPEEMRRSGVDGKLVGIEVAGDALTFELSRTCDALSNGTAVGTVTGLIGPAGTAAILFIDPKKTAPLG